MTIAKISGSNFGGIRTVKVDYLENVTSEGTIPATAITLPTREGSTSASRKQVKTPAGTMYDVSVQGFCSGINEANLAGFEALNDRRIIAWITDYHGQTFIVGNLDQPARFEVDPNFPGDIKTAQGFNFTITSRTTSGLTVL